MTIENPAPLTRAEVHADARHRAKRTLIQNAAAVIVLAVIGALAEALIDITPDKLFDGAFWVALGVAVLVAGLGALGSYLQRIAEAGRKAGL